jgi:hypothetical protein
MRREWVCADQKRPRPMWTNVNDIPHMFHKQHIKPPDSNMLISQFLLVDLFQLIGKDMLLDHSTYLLALTFRMVFGLVIMTQGIWGEQDWIMVLSPQQFVLGQIKGKVHSGYPRTIVFLRCSD